MSKFSSHCMISGIECSIVWRATSLPSTLSTPVPPRPIPLTLLNASVPNPRPSYLKSNSSVCLPGERASGPSQRVRLRSTRLYRNTGFTALRDVDLRLEAVGRVENARRIAVWCPGDLAGPVELAAAGREAGARRDEARRHPRIELEDLVFSRLLLEQGFLFLELLRVLGGDVVELRPILREIIQFIRETGRCRR